MSFSAQIKGGDIVHFTYLSGVKGRGRAVMKSSHGGWVLNCGVRPVVVDDSNIFKVVSSKKKIPLTKPHPWA